MPIKPLDRLLFAQGHRCFFCEGPLPRAEASIEHLVALANDGKDNDENCVACCKALNSLFGRMSLKEKLGIILNQKGDFACPAKQSVTLPPDSLNSPQGSAELPVADKLQAVLKDLHRRGAAKPGTVDKLKNTINSLLRNGETPEDLDLIVKQLISTGNIAVSDEKVIYSLK